MRSEKPPGAAAVILPSRGRCAMRRKLGVMTQLTRSMTTAFCAAKTENFTSDAAYRKWQCATMQGGKHGSAPDRRLPLRMATKRLTALCIMADAVAESAVAGSSSISRIKSESSLSNTLQLEEPPASRSKACASAASRWLVEASSEGTCTRLTSSFTMACANCIAASPMGKATRKMRTSNSPRSRLGHADNSANMQPHGLDIPGTSSLPRRSCTNTSIASCKFATLGGAASVPEGCASSSTAKVPSSSCSRLSRYSKAWLTYPSKPRMPAADLT
mmetsp:Transcript_103772/g.302910  ORF Transcript_103772/g.302910 Transcript_103772/m.302910 type:complete len:274 (+) Transcript_103772:68-889(+)